MFRQLRGEGNNQVKDYTHTLVCESYTTETGETYVGYLENTYGTLEKNTDQEFDPPWNPLGIYTKLQPVAEQNLVNYD